jgi:hypothetical protein
VLVCALNSLMISSAWSSSSAREDGFGSVVSGIRDAASVERMTAFSIDVNGFSNAVAVESRATREGLKARSSTTPIWINTAHATMRTGVYESSLRISNEVESSLGRTNFWPRWVKSTPSQICELVLALGPAMIQLLQARGDVLDTRGRLLATDKTRSTTWTIALKLPTCLRLSPPTP